MESASCDIMRLPRELLAVIVSLTSPPDACRAAAVSRAFCAAADSDTPSGRSYACTVCRSTSSHAGSGPFEAAELLGVVRLKIRGTIHSTMLSRNTTYGVYLVFKLASTGFYGLDFPFQHASVSAGGRASTRQVCVQGYDITGRDNGMPPRHIFGSRVGNKVYHYELPLTDDIILPRYRNGGWMELELGEFYNKEGYDGKVSVGLTETKGVFKSGLIVAGIQIRSKR